MNMSTLLKLMYPPPPSLFVTAMSVISGVSLANAGYMEFKGKHMQYSKFWNLGIDQNKLQKPSEPVKLSGRNGMLVAYTPAFLAGVTSFAVFPGQDLRFTLLTSALTFHFFKRIFEVLFIHKYSGSMPLESAVTISSSYFLSTATMIYAQHLTRAIPEPAFDLKYAGTGIFILGIIGNFYHHYLLSKLRETTSDDKEYKIPQGGLFNLVICPHYLFEILVFIGASCISQTIYAFSFTAGTTIYLMGRSYATRKWYLSKFEDFPKDVKSLIPFIF